MRRRVKLKWAGEVRNSPVIVSPITEEAFNGQKPFRAWADELVCYQDPFIDKKLPVNISTPNRFWWHSYKPYKKVSFFKKHRVAIILWGLAVLLNCLYFWWHLRN